MSYNKQLPATEITDKVTRATVDFAEDFGNYLGTDKKERDPKTGRNKIVETKLTTSQ